MRGVRDSLIDPYLGRNVEQYGTGVADTVVAGKDNEVVARAEQVKGGSAKRVGDFPPLHLSASP